MATAEKTPKAKGKGKQEKPSATILAFREYERVSYYLATQGVFDFSVDDIAREALHASFDGDDMSAEIKLCIANRLDPDEGISYRVPKGDHIEPGLEMRTKERVRLFPPKPEKQATAKAPKVEKLNATPSMKRLLKKKGATSVDEAGDLS